MATPYLVQLSDDAQNSFRKLDGAIRQRAAVALRKLAQDPRPPHLTAIKGSKGTFRVKFAKDYRIIYEVYDSQVLVIVIDLGHRSTIYDGS